MSRYRGELPLVEMPSGVPPSQALPPSSTQSAATQLSCRRWLSLHGPVGTSFALPALALMFLAGSLAGCGPEPYHQQDERYVLIATNVALPYWQEAQAGLQDSAKVLGVKAEMIGPDGYAPDKELETFQKAVAEKPAGILVSVARPEAFKAAIDAAVGQGIPEYVLTPTRPTPNACYLSVPIISARARRVAAAWRNC